MSGNKQSILPLILVATIHGMVHTLSLFLSPLNAEIARYFQLESITGVTAFKTSYLVVYALTNLVFGILTNRISARLILGFGIILNGLAVMAFRLVPPDGIVLMHVLWILSAAGGGVYHPVANVFITRLYPARKGWALGMTGMGAGIGYAFGPFLTGFLSSALMLDWQETSAVFGALAVLCGCVSFFFIHEIRENPAGNTPAAVSGVSIEENPRGSSGTGKKGFWGLSFGLWGFLIFVISIAGIRDLSMWTLLDISDFYITDIRSEPIATAWILFFMYLPAIFIQPFIGGLSDRVGRRILSVIVLTAYGLSMMFAAFVPFGFLLIPYVLIGITQSPSTPLMEAFVSDYTTPRTRGIIFGIYVTANTGIGALGPLLGGAFLDSFNRTEGGFQALLVGMGTLVFLGGIAMIFSGRVSRALGVQPESSGGA